MTTPHVSLPWTPHVLLEKSFLHPLSLCKGERTSHLPSPVWINALGQPLDPAQELQDPQNGSQGWQQGGDSILPVSNNTTARIFNHLGLCLNILPSLRAFKSILASVKLCPQLLKLGIAELNSHPRLSTQGPVSQVRETHWCLELILWIYAVLSQHWSHSRISKCQNRDYESVKLHFVFTSQLISIDFHAVVPA